MTAVGVKPFKAAGRRVSLERVLFARVELWAVLLILLFGCLLAIGYGAAVLDAEREDNRLGPVSRGALAVAEIPQNTYQLLTRDTALLVENSPLYKSMPTGWSFPSGPMTTPGGYILLSRYDGSEKRNKLDLVSLPSMNTVHSWTLDANQLLKDVTHVSRFADHDNWDRAHFRQIHPWLTENGDLIVKDHDSPLVRIDPCGKVLWTLQDEVYHHSTEADAGGDLWIPSTADKQTIPGVNDMFRENMISQVSPSGKLLFRRSVAQILMRHGFTNWLFTKGMYNHDPIHLNDIEPVLKDGPYWKKGDLFLSLRNVSAVLLYRPSTDEIVWIKRGPWLAQHDVDILDDHRIGIYDNAVEGRTRWRPYFQSSSQVVVYDFATDKISRPLEKAMKENKVQTVDDGLFTRLPDGSTLIEGSRAARLIIFRPDGSIAARYINRAKNGWIYHLGWNRYIDPAKGDIILRNLRKVQCNA
jgi:hypothetical protein